MPTTENQVRTWAVAALCGIVGLVLLHAWTPDGDAASSICLLRRLFHLPCPGCGMTRAFASLAKGDWPAAVKLHPLAPVLAVELAAGWAIWGIALASRGTFQPFRPDRTQAVLLANLAALVALWLGRVATGTLPW
ncbi:MAG TPA: DUF2752 domain-containing protein [Thermoanaerobaculia bacterium]|nr:DUF2752 domain-containing protein [Thermoanaerobaculia bacterium]